MYRIVYINLLCHNFTGHYHHRSKYQPIKTVYQTRILCNQMTAHAKKIHIQLKYFAEYRVVGPDIVSIATARFSQKLGKDKYLKYNNYTNPLK